MSIPSSSRATPALVLLTLALFAAPVTSQVIDMPEPAQETGPPPGPVLFWGSYGMGLPFVFGGDVEGNAEFAQLGVERDGRAVLLRRTEVDEPYGPGSEPLEEFGLMFGATRQSGILHLMGAVGISRLTGFECVDADDPEECAEAGTFGFPVFAEVTLDILPFLGVGVQAFANLNADVRFGGIGLVGHIGRLR